MNAEMIHSLLAIAIIAGSCAILSPILCWIIAPRYIESN